jgi:hypothetical protein
MPYLPIRDEHITHRQAEPSQSSSYVQPLIPGLFLPLCVRQKVAGVSLAFHEGL